MHNFDIPIIRRNCVANFTQLWNSRINKYWKIMCNARSIYLNSGLELSRHTHDRSDSDHASYPALISLKLCVKSWPTESSDGGMMGARGNRLPSNSKPLTSLVGHGTVADATVTALSFSLFFPLFRSRYRSFLWYLYEATVSHWRQMIQVHWMFMVVIS